MQADAAVSRRLSLDVGDTWAGWRPDLALSRLVGLGFAAPSQAATLRGAGPALPAPGSALEGPPGAGRADPAEWALVQEAEPRGTGRVRRSSGARVGAQTTTGGATPTLDPASTHVVWRPREDREEQNWHGSLSTGELSAPAASGKYVPMASLIIPPPRRAG